MKHASQNKDTADKQKASSSKSFQLKRRREIRLLCDTIAQEFQPEKIVLFGSYAYGKPTEDSDIDLLVVMPFEGSPFRQASNIIGRVINIVGVLPIDLLVRTAEQVKDRISMGDTFMSEILERGKAIYETHPHDQHTTKHKLGKAQRPT